MIISNQKNAFVIEISDLILTNVSTVKFLGIKIYENLTFNDHVNEVINKIFKHKNTKISKPKNTKISNPKNTEISKPADVMV